MKFVVVFTYNSSEQEKLLNFVQFGGLVSEDPVKVIGAWLAVQTTSRDAVVDTNDSKALYQICSSGSQYGQITVTPVLDASAL